LNERNAEVVRGNAQAARANELSAELVELKRKMSSEIILPTGTGNTQINEHGKTLFEYLLPRFAPKLVVGVVLAALGHFHRDKENETDILKEVSKWPFLRNLLKKHKEEVIEERDKQIYDHLTTNVFNPKKATLLRNTLGHSMRTSNYMQNTWKFNRMMDGTKERNRLAPDSKQWAPEPINMRNILETEATSVADLQFKSCNNGMGATVGGGKYSVDGIMLKIREDSKKSRNGGFVQACTKDDPGIMCLAGDGAQLSKKYSGVRVSLFAGSTNCLNQSSLEIYNLAIYKATEQAESYATLTSNLADVLPALKRIYRDGGLLRNADGSDSGVYVRCLPHAP